MAVSVIAGPRMGVFVIRAPLFGVYIRAISHCVGDSEAGVSWWVSYIKEVHGQLTICL